MAGLDPAIHLLRKNLFKMDTRVKPGHDDVCCVTGLNRHRFISPITPRATSRFQMNSTTSAPMVAVMKPAPWLGP